MRATRATTAAIEAAKLELEQRRSATASENKPATPSPSRRHHRSQDASPVKEELKPPPDGSAEMEPSAKSLSEQKSKDKTPHKLHSPKKHSSGSQSEKKPKKHKLSPLKTRSASKLESYAKESPVKSAKKRQHVEVSGESLVPRKLLLVDTSVTSSMDQKSPDRRSVRSRSMSNGSMPPFSPIKSEASDVIDLDAFEDSFTDNTPSATPVKAKKKKRDKEKSRKKDKHKKDKKDRSPKKKDKLYKHSKEYKRVKKKLKMRLKMLKKERREKEAASGKSSSDNSSSSGSGSATPSSAESLPPLPPPQPRLRVKTPTKPAGACNRRYSIGRTERPCVYF